AVHRPQLEALIKRVSFHIETQAGTPYRKAVAHLKQTLGDARRGETAVETVPDDPAPVVRRVGLGERVPDFVVVSLTGQQPVRFQATQGRPTLIVFYNPATKMGRDVMLYAKELCEKQSGKLHVMAMAVTPTPETARKQHDDLRLPFPVLDGHSLRLTLVVEHTPRFLPTDGQGVLRWARAG